MSALELEDGYGHYGKEGCFSQVLSTYHYERAKISARFNADLAALMSSHGRGSGTLPSPNSSNSEDSQKRSAVLALCAKLNEALDKHLAEFLVRHRYYVFRALECAQEAFPHSGLFPGLDVLMREYYLSGKR